MAIFYTCITPACNKTSSDLKNRAVYTPAIEVLEDRNSNFSFEDVSSGKYQFIRADQERVNIGYTYSTWWARVTTDNSDIKDGDYILLYDQTWTDTVDAYVKNGNGFSYYKAGSENGFPARPYKDKAYGFPVKVVNGKTEAYFKLKSDYRLVLDFALMSSEEFFTRKWFEAPFYSVLISFLIYNIILFFFIRGSEYLYYGGFLLTFLLFLLAYDGTGMMYLWSSSPHWNDFLITGMLILQSFWVVLFFLKFADVKASMPKVDIFFKTLAVLTLLAMCLKIILPEKHVLLWSVPLLQIIAVSLLSVSFYMAVKGSKTALYFFLSFFMLLVFSLANSLMAFNIIKDMFIIRMGMHIGASICAVTFSLGMADRINALRLSMEQSERTVKNQNLKLERKNDELDATNQELQAAMEELEATNEEMEAMMEELQSSNQLLWDSEQRLSGIVTKAPVGITITDLKGCIIQVNDYALRMLGYERDELIGKTFREISHPDDITEGAELFFQLVSGKLESYRLDKRYLRKDGADWWADISVAPIKSETGEITAILGVTLDINEKMKANRENEKIQNQLWQAQKLEAVGTLAGGIAHDFNNILTAIMGYTELTISEIQEGKCSEENLQHVLNSSRRARDIVRQILTLSRKGDNIKSPQRVTPIVDETIRLLRATIPSTVEINFSDKSDSPIVICDSTQIQQILLNLCTNANHAMRQKGGVITIELSLENVDEHSAMINMVKKGEFICIRVSDSGAGMNRDILDRIFDPFFTTKEPGLGTGLGLSVARGIIIDHGGFITAESEEGMGSTFRVYIPVSRDVSEIVKVSIEQDDLPGGDESLLIVDDEHLIAEMTKLLLQKLGYSVQTSSGSLEALETFRSSPDYFDLIITDQTMPHMTGLDLAKEIKKIRPDVPVILCTGYSETADPEKALGTGISAFLYKPVLTEDLAETIRKVLEGRN